MRQAGGARQGPQGRSRQLAGSQEFSQAGEAPGEPGSSGPAVHLFQSTAGARVSVVCGRAAGGSPYGGPSTRVLGAPVGHPTGFSTPRALGSALPSCLRRRRPPSHSALAAVAPGPALAGQPAGRAAVVSAAAVASVPQRPRCHGSGFALAGQPMGGGGWVIWEGGGGMVPLFGAPGRWPSGPSRAPDGLAVRCPRDTPLGLIRYGTSANSAGGRRGVWRRPDSSSVPGQRQAPNGQSPFLGPEGSRRCQASGGRPRR